jgi:predicted amidohydrolase
MVDGYPNSPLNVAAVAMRSEFGNVEHNLSGMLRWMDVAAQRGADLVCFPEIALQGYCTLPILIRGLAETIDGPSCTALAQKASELGVTVSAGMSLREGDRVYNSQVFIGPSGFLGAQHKVHICGNDRAYDPSSSWNIVRVGEWDVGTTICFDAEFPEAARIQSIKGAHLLLMSFATGRRNSLNQAARPEEWVEELMCWAPARAYDNRVFVVGVNHGGEVRDDRGLAVANTDGRPGEEEWAPPGTVHRWPGYSFAISPRGAVFAESDRSQRDENMLLVELDPDVMREARTPLSVKWPSGEVEGHFLEVRRTDTFGELLSRYDKGEA